MEEKRNVRHSIVLTLNWVVFLCVQLTHTPSQRRCSNPQTTNNFLNNGFGHSSLPLHYYRYYFVLSVCCGLNALLFCMRPISIMSDKLRSIPTQVDRVCGPLFLRPESLSLPSCSQKGNQKHTPRKSVS